MKLAITQVVLGIIIIMASLWVTGWMVYQAPDLLRSSALHATTSQPFIDVVPEDNTLFTLARYSSYALPVFGILLVISGAVLAAGKTTRRFWPLLNIAIGVLAAVLVVGIAIWGYPTAFEPVTSGVIPPDGTEVLAKIFSNPGPKQVHSQEIAAAMVLPSVAALGVGIVQLVKSRKAQSI